MLSANAARDMADKAIDGEYKRDSYNIILGKIKAAAERGNYMVRIGGTIEPINAERLVKLGKFRVLHLEDRDQHQSTEIHW